MSRATREETLIRSLVEGFCITLAKHYQSQPRQRIKVQAVAAIQESIEDLWQAFPIQLTPREGDRVVKVINYFDAEQEGDPELSRPEVLTAMALALVDKLQRVSRYVKKDMVDRMAGQIQTLYDCFDRQTAKLDLLIKGGELADKVLAREF